MNKGASKERRGATKELEPVLGPFYARGMRSGRSQLIDEAITATGLTRTEVQRWIYNRKKMDRPSRAGEVVNGSRLRHRQTSGFKPCQPQETQKRSPLSTSTKVKMDEGACKEKRGATKELEPVLGPFYARGMRSGRSQLIDEAITATGLTRTEVQRWIYNRKKMDRPSRAGEVVNGSRLRHRQTSGYMVYQAQEMRKHRVGLKVSRKWTDLTPEEQAPYITMAREQNKTVELVGTVEKAQRLISRGIRMLEEEGYSVFAVACMKAASPPVTLGTECGQQFLHNYPAIANKFHKFVNGEVEPSPRKVAEAYCESEPTARKIVEHAFNEAYRRYTGKPSGRCPYTKVLSGELRVCGLPDGVPFRRAGAYSTPEALAIQASTITFEEPTPTTKRGDSEIDPTALSTSTTTSATSEHHVSEAKPAPSSPIVAELYEVEEILDSRSTGAGVEYLMRWTGYDETHNSWEPADNILDHRLLQSFFSKKT